MKLGDTINLYYEDLQESEIKEQAINKIKYQTQLMKLEDVDITE